MNAIFLQFKAYFYGALALVIIALFAGTFFFGMHYQKLECQAETDRQRIAYQVLIDKEQSRYDDIASTFTGKLENLKIVNTTVNRNFKTELTNTVYKDCVLPETGVQLLNNTVKQLNATRISK